MYILCEFDNPTNNITALHNFSLADSNATLWKVNITLCPLGHVTKDFLSCDSQSLCGAEESSATCHTATTVVRMFVCDDGRQSLPYSLVCDYIKHCSDKSDEDFCQFQPCTRGMFQCRNGQCISSESVCDGRLDCFDRSDEVCNPVSYTHLTLPTSDLV